VGAQADRYVVGLGEIDQTLVALAGGKGAGLGQVRRKGTSIEAVAGLGGALVRTSRSSGPRAHPPV